MIVSIINQIDFRNMNWKTDRKLFYITNLQFIYYITFLTWFLSFKLVGGCTRCFFFITLSNYYHYGSVTLKKHWNNNIFSKLNGGFRDVYPKSIETYSQLTSGTLTYNRPDFTRTYYKMKCRKNTEIKSYEENSILK